VAINTNPIYSGIGDIQWSSGAMTAANTTDDLTSGTIYLVFTAAATVGGFVQRIRFRALGTNVATVARVWINNGSTTGTAANNILWDELTLAATTATESAALATYELPLGFALPAGYRLYVTLGTAVSAGYHSAVIGGNYTAQA
jgi:hypothetical protein